jgi:dihydroorotate dehydrogenase
LLVKISPDLTAAERQVLAEGLTEMDIDGLIVSNTTISRPEGMVSGARAEEGGLSGAPLFAASTEALSDFYRLTEGNLLLIGVGGISSGREAYAKIRAGASLVQLYTAMIYEGPGLVRRVGQELAECLKKDGFGNIAEAVGAAHR